MTPAALRALILALADDHPAKVAYLAGNDEACATALRAKTIRGPVPIAELSSYCTSEGITGAVETVAYEPPTGGAITFSLKALCRTVLTLIRDDYRLTTADVDHVKFGPACDGLIAAGLMTGDQKTAILALADNRGALVEGAHHLQVAEARIA